MPDVFDQVESQPKQDVFDRVTVPDPRSEAIQAAQASLPMRRTPIPTGLQGPETTGEAVKRNLLSGTVAAGESAGGLATGLVRAVPLIDTIEGMKEDYANRNAPRKTVSEALNTAVQQGTGISAKDLGAKLGTGDYGSAVGSIAPQLLAAVLLRRAFKGAPEAATETPKPVEVAPHTLEVRTTPAVPSPDAPAIAPDAAARLSGLQRFAGKGTIDTSTINSPEAVTTAINSLSRNLDPRVAQVIGLDAQKQLASDLGMTEQELLSRRSGQAFNAEQSIAARSLLKASQDDVLSLAQKASTDPASVEAFTNSLARHRMIADSVQGVASESGRSLGSFRIGEEELPAAKITNALSRLSPEQAQTAAQLLAKTDVNNPSAVSRFVSEITPSSTLDKMHEVWMEGLLTGPAFLKKFVSDLYMTAQSPVAKLVGGAPRSAYYNFMGTLHGLGDAVDAFSHSFKYETSFMHSSEFANVSRGAVKGATGRIVRMPTRVLAATADFFGRLNYTRSLYEQAHLEAAGDAARVSELLDRPTQAMRDTAMDYAKRQTFQSDNPLTRVLSNVQNWKPLEDSPSFKPMMWVMPFSKTPANIGIEMMRTTPLGFAETLYKAAKTGTVDHELLGKNLIGTAAFAWALKHAMNGELSGAGPDSRNDRLALEQSGWQPYSVKAGNRWVSYQNMFPIVGTLSAAADLAERMKSHPSEDHADLFVRGLAISAKDSTEHLPFMTVLTNAADMKRSADSGRVASFVGHSVGSAIPTAVADVAHLYDPTVRVPDRNAALSTRISQIIESRVPGLSRNVPPLLAPNRQPIQRPPSALGGFNPFAVSGPITPAQVSMQNRIGAEEGRKALQAAQRKRVSSRLIERRSQ